MTDYEKLGAFYLGATEDPANPQHQPAPLLYDSKDLCTHAVIVGMTGSGKTGLGVGLIEEAAIDGVPSLIIDPKGDMANLLLQFPELRPDDFEPWVDPGAAARKGQTVPEFAGATASLWKKGLGDWAQDGQRIQRLKDAAEFTVFTPGSTAGRPLRVLRSFAAPPPAQRDDPEAFADAIQSAVAGLLSLLALDDSLQSREGILLSNILQHSWSAGRDLDLAQLIAQVQAPPFQKLGVLDVEAFFPGKDRFKLAMTINGLLASPGFAAWMEGEPLDVKRLLHTPEGKPRVSIFSIAHLSDAERMFFVTRLLGEVVTWMRGQGGTSSLRALLYMDEIFGYFPPSAEPPSKRPMLTLLKQARAFGLGVVLSTQNPVDLDYKGLSNTGTWFIGRLQTERDKLRVLDGLEGALAAGGQAFSREHLDRLLSGLGKRVFLLNNVHESGPELFRTRWVLSYLRGPMTRQEIRRLCAAQGPPPAPVSPAARPAPVVEPAPPATPEAAPRPHVADGKKERFLARRGDIADGASLVYRPTLFSEVNLHFARVSLKVDEWKPLYAVASLPAEGDEVDWENGELEQGEPELDLRSKPETGARFAAVSDRISAKKPWITWRTSLKSELYRSQSMTFYRCKDPKGLSAPGETEGDFRVRLRQLAREERNLAMDKLKAKYTPKIERMDEKVRKAKQKIDKEEEQYEAKRSGSWLDIGKTVLGGLFGGKVASRTNVSSARTAMRSRAATAKEKADIKRAEKDLASIEEQRAELIAEFEEELDELKGRITLDEFELREDLLRPRKTDLDVTDPLLLWRPWTVDAAGIATPAWLSIPN